LSAIQLHVVRPIHFAGAGDKMRTADAKMIEQAHDIKRRSEQAGAVHDSLADAERLQDRAAQSSDR